MTGKLLGREELDERVRLVRHRLRPADADGEDAFNEILAHIAALETAQQEEEGTMGAHEAAKQIVEAIMFDADDRSLLDGVEEDIRREILYAWTEIVAEKIAQIEEKDR
jgi:hypothetical protein